MPAHPTAANSPWPNFDHRQIPYRGMVATYRLYHPASGLYYVGSSLDLFGVFSALSSKLRSGAVSNNRLQELYRQAPHFEVEVCYANDLLPRESQRFEAAELAQRWIAELGGRCINKRRFNDRVRKPRHHVTTEELEDLCVRQKRREEIARMPILTRWVK